MRFLHHCFYGFSLKNKRVFVAIKLKDDLCTAYIIVMSEKVVSFEHTTRSTQRAQTSLAEADHYSHIVHCKNVEPWLWKTTHPPKKKKKKKKVLDHYLHHDLGMLPLLRCFFAHLLILQYPDHHQNLISSSLYYSGPVHKISSQSVHNFLSNVVHRQTNRQTDKPTLPRT